MADPGGLAVINDNLFKKKVNIWPILQGKNKRKEGWLWKKKI